MYLFIHKTLSNNLAFQFIIINHRALSIIFGGNHIVGRQMPRSYWFPWTYIDIIITFLLRSHGRVQYRVLLDEKTKIINSFQTNPSCYSIGTPSVCPCRRITPNRGSCRRLFDVYGIDDTACSLVGGHILRESNPRWNLQGRKKNIRIVGRPKIVANFNPIVYLLLYRNIILYLRILSRCPSL